MWCNWEHFEGMHWELDVNTLRTILVPYFKWYQLVVAVSLLLIRDIQKVALSLGVLSPPIPSFNVIPAK
jgi:hypothetical protein